MDPGLHCPLQGRYQVPGQGGILQGLSVGRPSEIAAGKPENLPGVAIIPQVGRRGRIILNLSFAVYQDQNGVVTITQESMNYTTVLQAPLAPVKEIGRVLPRLLHYMRDTPAGLHILFCKLDISDGFWRLIVRAEDSFNCA